MLITSGASIGVNDFEIPDDKDNIINSAQGEVQGMKSNSNLVYSPREKNTTKLLIFDRTNERVASSMMKALGDKG